MNKSLSCLLRICIILTPLRPLPAQDGGVDKSPVCYWPPVTIALPATEEKADKSAPNDASDVGLKPAPCRGNCWIFTASARLLEFGSCRFSALLFKTPYGTFSSRSSIMPIRFLPGPLLPSILPSITSFINPSPLIICPIQFFFRRTIVSSMVLLSPTLLRTSSFVFFSVQLMRSILLHIHISSASILLISSFLSDHVSAQYKATDQITVFTIFFFTALLIPLVSNSFLLLKASFAIPILVLISVSHLPSSVIQAPKYLNLLTCSIFCPSITILITPPFLLTFMTRPSSVRKTFPGCGSAWKKPSIKTCFRYALKSSSARTSPLMSSFTTGLSAVIFVPLT